MCRAWGWRECAMRGLRFDGLKAATALAVIFAGMNCLPATAGLTDDKAISAAIPMPEPADVAPPSAADVSSPSAMTSKDIDLRVPVPESANLPPPSLDDVGGPATATSDPRISDPVSSPAAAAPAAPAPAAAAPAAAAPTAPAPTAAAPADENPIVAAMRELVGSKLGRFVERKNDRAAIETFYVKRAFAPLWVENGEASARAKTAIS